MLLVKIQRGTGCRGSWHEFKKRSDLQAELLRGNGHVLAIVSTPVMSESETKRILELARNEYEAKELHALIDDLSSRLDAARERLTDTYRLTCSVVDETKVTPSC